MNNLKIQLTSLLALLCFSWATAQTEAPLNISLAEAQKIALENNYSVKTSKIDLSLAKQKIVETTAIGLPQITANVSYQHIFKVPEISFGKAFYVDKDQKDAPITKGSDLDPFFHDGQAIKLGVADNITWDITASQLIFSGEYIVGLQASRTYSRLSEEMLQKSERDIKDQVSQNYYTALVVQENVKILQSSLVNLDKVIAEMTQMNKQGLVDETDVDQFQISKLTLQNTVTTLTRQKDIALNALKFAMGVENTRALNLTDSLANYTSNAGLEYAGEQLMLTNNIDYKLAETNVALMNLSWKREKSAYLPTVAAFYRHQENLKKSDFDMSMPDIFGASFEWKLFTSLGRNSKVSQARLNYERAKVSQEQAGQGLLLDFELSRNNYIAAFDKMSTQKQNFELSKKIYDRTLIKYKNGISSSLDVTNAQNQFLTAQSNYFTAVTEFLTAKSKIEKLLSKN
jgi:outer membrane protein